MVKMYENRDNINRWRKSEESKSEESKRNDSKTNMVRQSGEIKSINTRFNNNYHKYRNKREIELYKKSRNSTVIKTLVNNVNIDYVKPKRAGIIMYTAVNGTVFFGFGLDARTHDLTDFGGSVIYKVDKNCINGAIREFNEETLEIFHIFKFDDIKQCPVIYDENNLIIFVHMNVNPDDVSCRFNEQYRKIMNNTKRLNKEPEVCGITWLSWEDFQVSIKERGILFSRVQKFLSRAGDFSYLL